MKLSQLKEFIAIVDHGSLRGAARKLGVTAPALSKSLGRLEDELHVPLLIRNSRGVTPSAYGQALLRRARLIHAESQKASDEIAQLRGGLEGVVTVGISPTPAIALLPDVLPRFRQRFPDARVNIVGGASDAQLAAIRSGSMDFAVMSTPEEGLDTGFESDDLFYADLIVAARKGHPLSKARSLTELADCEWIVTGPNRKGPGSAILDAFQRHALPQPSRLVQCDTTWALNALLTKSDMLCAISRLMLDHPMFSATLVAIPIKETLPRYRISLIHLAGSPLLPVAMEFATLMKRYANYLCVANPRISVPPRKAIKTRQRKG